MYQNWVGESATRYTRMHLSRLNAARRSDGPGESGGRAAAIIGAEVEQLGAFVGESVSEPLVNLGILAALLGYMLVVEPLLALVSLGFLIPQVILIRSEEHTSELQSLMRISYAVFCLKKKKTTHNTDTISITDNTDNEYR